MIGKYFLSISILQTNINYNYSRDDYNEKWRQKTQERANEERAGHTNKKA